MDVDAVTRNESLHVDRGRLLLEDCDLVAIAERFGTPLFAVSESQLRRNYRRIRDAFADCWSEGEVHILPAFKAAPYIAIRKILSEEGAGCDTFGPSELEGAVLGDTPAELISVNGSLKSRETIRRGIELGARIVIDAPRELEICHEEGARLDKAARVLLRIKPRLKLELESDFAPVSIDELTQRLRYGLPTNEALPLGPKADRSEYINVIGFHCHIGRHSTQMPVWETLVHAAVALVAQLRESWGWRDWQPQILDFGGGYAPPGNYDTDHHRSGEPAPSIESYAKAMTEALRESLSHHGMSGEGLAIELEPGRALHSDTGVHLTRVGNIKESTGATRRKWAEVDTSEQFLGTYAMDPSVPPFKFIVANKADREANEIVDIVGKSCGGEMLLLDSRVPLLEAGDLIALLDTGAYIESLSCNFNAMPRPGTLLISDDQAEWIREPESIEQVFSRDRVPVWTRNNR